MNAQDMRSGMIGLVAVALLALGGLIAWNVSHFAGAQMKPREKDITFLPPPLVAQALVLGHRNSAAKLRWIDSTAYFQYQLDHRDDTVKHGGAAMEHDTRGGFERLYETLVHLDPHFIEYYHHGFLATDALASHPHAALGLIGLGLLEQPDNTQMWRLWLTQLVTRFSWEERQPEAFQAMLADWVAAEGTESGRQMVLDWSRGLSIRRFKGLEAVPWWQSQLAAAKPGSHTATFAEKTLRELIARWNERQWEELLARYRARHLAPPTFIEQLCTPELVQAQWPAGVPRFAPVEKDGTGAWRPRVDPFGYLPVLVDGRVLTPGTRRILIERQLYALRTSAAALITTHGRPGSVADLIAWGLKPQAPEECALDAEGLPVLREHVPPPQPWVLR